MERLDGVELEREAEAEVRGDNRRRAPAALGLQERQVGGGEREGVIEEGGGRPSLLPTCCHGCRRHESAEAVGIGFRRESPPRAPWNLSGLMMS